MSERSQLPLQSHVLLPSFEEQVAWIVLLGIGEYCLRETPIRGPDFAMLILGVVKVKAAVSSENISTPTAVIARTEAINEWDVIFYLFIMLHNDTVASKI